MTSKFIEILFQSSCDNTFRPDLASPHRCVVRSIVDLLLGGTEGENVLFARDLKKSKLLRNKAAKKSYRSYNVLFLFQYCTFKTGHNHKLVSKNCRLDDEEIAAIQLYLSMKINAFGGSANSKFLQVWECKL